MHGVGVLVTACLSEGLPARPLLTHVVGMILLQ